LLMPGFTDFHIWQSPNKVLMKPLLQTLKILCLTAFFFSMPAKEIFGRTVADSLLNIVNQEQSTLKKIPLYFQLGSNCKQGNKDSAFMFYNTGLKKALELKQDSLVGVGYYYLASLEYQIKNYRPALNYVDSAFRYLRETTNPLYLAELKTIKSNIFLRYRNAETRHNRNAIEKQQRTTNILWGAVILIILFSGLIFNRYQLKKKIESQQALLNERKRISHELHDDLGSQLCAARLFINNLRNSNNLNGEKNLIENSLSLIDTCIKDLRFIMNDLQTPVLLESGYIAATTDLVNKVNQLKQINFSLSHNGIYQRIESKKENNLFRITQELINNTLKYAHAKNVTIDVLKRDNNIILMYEDDGKGCNLQSANKGYGLNNIQSRSRSLGGTVAFDSFPGAGFRAIVEIPVLYA
jgi:signal transduction histidine kinase